MNQRHLPFRPSLLAPAILDLSRAAGDLPGQAPTRWRANALFR